MDENNKPLFEGVIGEGMPTPEQQFENATGIKFNNEEHEIVWSGADGDIYFDSMTTPFQVVKKQEREERSSTQNASNATRNSSETAQRANNSRGVDFIDFLNGYRHVLENVRTLEQEAMTTDERIAEINSQAEEARTRLAEAKTPEERAAALNELNNGGYREATADLEARRNDIDTLAAAKREELNNTRPVLNTIKENAQSYYNKERERLENNISRLESTPVQDQSIKAALEQFRKDLNNLNAHKKIFDMAIKRLDEGNVKDFDSFINEYSSRLTRRYDEYKSKEKASDDKSKNDDNKSQNDDNKSQNDDNKSQNDDNKSQNDDNKSQNDDDKSQNDDDKSQNDHNKSQSDDNKSQNDDDKSKDDDDKSKDDDDKSKDDDDKSKDDDDKSKDDDDKSKDDDDKSKDDSNNVKRLEIIYSGKDNKYLVRDNQAEEEYRDASYTAVKFKNQKEKIEYLRQRLGVSKLKETFGDDYIKSMKKVIKKCDAQLLYILGSKDTKISKEYIDALKSGEESKDKLPYTMKYNLKGMKKNHKENKLGFIQRIKNNILAKRNRHVAEYIPDDKNRKWLIFPVVGALAAGAYAAHQNEQDKDKVITDPTISDTMDPTKENQTQDSTRPTPNPIGPSQVTIDEDNKITIENGEEDKVEDLVLGSKVNLVDGITYTQDSLGNGNTAKVGDFSWRPAGEYTVDRVALYHNGNLIANIGTAGTNIDETIKKCAEKLGVDASEISQVAHVCIGENHDGATGWLKPEEFSMQDLKNNISKSYDEIQAEKAAKTQQQTQRPSQSQSHESR